MSEEIKENLEEIAETKVADVVTAVPEVENAAAKPAKETKGIRWGIVIMAFGLVVFLAQLFFVASVIFENIEYINFRDMFLQVITMLVPSALLAALGLIIDQLQSICKELKRK